MQNHQHHRVVMVLKFSKDFIQNHLTKDSEHEPIWNSKTAETYEKKNNHVTTFLIFLMMMILLHKTFGPFPNNKWSPKVRASAASRHIQAYAGIQVLPQWCWSSGKKNLLLNYGPSETCVSRAATSLAISDLWWFFRDRSWRLEGIPCGWGNIYWNLHTDVNSVVHCKMH